MMVKCSFKAFITQPLQFVKRFFYIKFCCVLSVCRGVVIRRWWMRRARCHLVPSQLPHYQSFRMYCCSSSTLRPPHWVSLSVCSWDSQTVNLDLLLKELYIFITSYFITQCIFIFKWFGKGTLVLNLFKSPFPVCSRAWQRKWASGVFQPGPALLRAHPSRRLLPQHLHVHAYFPWWPGFWLPPAAPALPQRRALGWIRAQRAGGRQQWQEWGMLGGICCWCLWCVMSHLYSCTTQQCGVKGLTWSYCLFNRIPVCRSQWKSITTPVLILMRCTHLSFSISFHNACKSIDSFFFYS